MQPSTKRIFHDAQYEDVGCEVSDDLSECGLIIGIKQPKVRVIAIQLVLDIYLRLDRCNV